MRTRVGYAGGTRPNPTYHGMGDHTETFQVDYDPKVIRYEQLLEVFWSAHDPTGPAWSRQYRAVILAHGPEQQKLAEATRDARQKTLPRPITTAIEPFKGFTRAEDYHQKFRLRNAPQLVAPLLGAYPKGDAFTDSTAAMRINAYLAGHGDPERFAKELPLLGLGEDGQALLREQFEKNR